MKKNIIFFFLLFFAVLKAQNMGLKLPVGTLPNASLDVNGSMAFRESSALILANGINTDVVINNFSFFRITGPTAAFTITGFTSGSDGRTLTLINATSQTLTLTHQTGSSVANQLNTGGTNITLEANGVAIFVYNITLTKWVLSGGKGFKYDWLLTGNGSTSVGSYFLGTSDARSFALKANNVEGIRLTSTGNVGIGGTIAQNNLDVGGNAVIGANLSGTSNASINGLLVEGNTGLGSTLKIGASPSSINASSALEIESTTKGFVPPRMTDAEMNAIAAPLLGSMVFNTTSSCFHQYKATDGWVSLCPSTLFTFEALQSSILQQNFDGSGLYTGGYTNIPGLGGLSINFPRTGKYFITVRSYFASGARSVTGYNSGAKGSFRLVIDGTNYEESFLGSEGIQDTYNGFNFWGLGTQGTATKLINLSAGTHTISIQGRSWFGTNCNFATWGIDTSGYVNSNGVQSAWCKLTIVEN
jgi:hypothetical protein